jgi:hypothetical protein
LCRRNDSEEAAVSAITEGDIKDRTQTVIDGVGIDADEVTFRAALWDAGLARVQ